MAACTVSIIRGKGTPPPPPPPRNRTSSTFPAPLPSASTGNTSRERAPENTSRERPAPDERPVITQERHDELLTEIARLHAVIDSHASPTPPGASSASGSRVETEVNAVVEKQKIAARAKQTALKDDEVRKEAEQHRIDLHDIDAALGPDVRVTGYKEAKKPRGASSD